jgi:hypothetical protein
LRGWLISIAESFQWFSLSIWGKVIALTWAARLVVWLAVPFPGPGGVREEAGKVWSLRSSAYVEVSKSLGAIMWGLI